jgi:hypothetical protein
MQHLTIPQHQIDRLRAARGNDWDQFAPDIQQTRSFQRMFIGYLLRVRDPNIACQRAGIEIATYRQWKRSDPEFCEMLNECIETLKAELSASAYNRAKGYYTINDDGELLSDPMGTPIIQGGSDTLAIKMLGLDKRNQHNKEVTVTLTIVPRDRYA